MCFVYSSTPIVQQCATLEVRVPWTNSDVVGFHHPALTRSDSRVGCSCKRGITVGAGQVGTYYHDATSKCSPLLLHSFRAFLYFSSSFNSTSCLSMISLLRSVRSGHQSLEAKHLEPPSATGCAVAHDHFPTELIQEFLQWLIIPNLWRMSPFVYETPARHQCIATEDFLLGQWSLAKATLVCRLWNAIGTELLYSRPCLISSHQIRLLRRTIERAPDLARCIRGYLFADDEENRDYVYTINRKPRNIEGRKVDITTVLHPYEGSSLDMVTIGASRYSEPFLSSHFFFQALSVTTNLRKLVINGYFSDELFSFTAMPLLEEMCFCYSPITAKTRFPQLPRLRTLRLAHVVCWVDICEIIGRNRLPALRSLECYRCEFLIPALESLDLVPKLEELYLVGEAELAIFYQLFITSGLDQLQHIAIGLIDTLHHPLDLSDWRLSERLQKLTIFGVVSGNASLSTLHRCLQRNIKPIRSRFFRQLVYYSSVQQFDDEWVQELSSFGSSKDISVELKKTNINAWITERLA